jgi:hypothetical protein
MGFSRCRLISLFFNALTHDDRPGYATLQLIVVVFLGLNIALFLPIILLSLVDFNFHVVVNDLQDHKGVEDELDDSA